MKNSSVLRYAGGKTRACKILMEVVDKYFDLRKCKYLISPFFGGGSFEFHFQNMNPKIKIIANDKFTPLYNFWKEVKEDKNSLIEELKKIKNVKKEEFFNYRKEINYYNEDSKKQAIIYFIINRCSFSGTTFSGGFSEEASKKRFTLSSIEKIGKLDLSLIEFHNKDFSEFIIDDYNNDEYLMFLDPPYYLENSKLYGIKGDLHKDFNHQQLFSIIKDKKNWILTYNDSSYIRDLYKEFTIIEAKWTYGMNKTKKSNEIIILSLPSH